MPGPENGTDGLPDNVISFRAPDQKGDQQTRPWDSAIAKAGNGISVDAEEYLRLSGMTRDELRADYKSAFNIGDLRMIRKFLVDEQERLSREGAEAFRAGRLQEYSAENPVKAKQIAFLEKALSEKPNRHR